MYSRLSTSSRTASSSCNEPNAMPRKRLIGEKVLLLAWQLLDRIIREKNKFASFFPNAKLLEVTHPSWWGKGLPAEKPICCGRCLLIACRRADVPTCDSLDVLLL